MYMPQQHVGCSVRTGGILLSSVCHDSNTSRSQIKPVYHLSTHPARFSNPSSWGNEREETWHTGRSSWCGMCSEKQETEGTRSLSSHTSAAVTARQHEARQRERCCKKRAPTWKSWARLSLSLSLLADSCPCCNEWGASGHSWAHVPGWGGWGGFGSKPRLASCEPFTARSSRRQLPSPMFL